MQGQLDAVIAFGSRINLPREISFELAQLA
jgi:hypothetical protein